MEPNAFHNGESQNSSAFFMAVFVHVSANSSRVLSLSLTVENKDITLAGFVPIAVGGSFLKSKPHDRTVVHRFDSIRTIRLDDS
jgi:hypothetical protein